MLVVDKSVPPAQLKMTLPGKDWMVRLAAGLTVTDVDAGTEAHPPIVAVTLNEPEEFVVAFTIEGF